MWGLSFGFRFSTPATAVSASLAKFKFTIGRCMHISARCVHVRGACAGASGSSVLAGRGGSACVSVNGCVCVLRACSFKFQPGACGCVRRARKGTRAGGGLLFCMEAS